MAASSLRQERVMGFLDPVLTLSRGGREAGGDTLWPMKIVSVLLSAAVVAVGLFAGVVAYQAASATPGAGQSGATAAPASPAAQRQHRQRPVVRWGPCKPPAKLQGRVCVTEEVRTVVVAPPAAAAPAPAPAVAPARAVGATRAEPGDGGGHEHESEHGEEREHEHEHEDD